jgi:hypothetical protein
MVTTYVFAPVLLLCIAAAVSIVAYTLRCGISPMPSSRRAAAILLKILRDNAVCGTVYELGSGWGTLAVTIARGLPQARITAIELSPVPYLFSKAYAAVCRCGNVTFVRKDFFTVGLEDADAVVCYLYRGGMERLADVLQRQAKPGTIIVSNTFALGRWNPAGVTGVGDIYRTNIYTYVKGL